MKKTTSLLAAITAVLMMCAVINPSAANAEKAPSTATPEVENNNETDTAEEESSAAVKPEETETAAAASCEPAGTAEAAEQTARAEEALPTAQPSAVSDAAPSAAPQPEANAEAEDTAASDVTIKTYTAENDYTVTVAYGAEADLPADAQLQVSNIADEDQLASLTGKTEDALSGQEGVTLAEARFFDISFTEEGREIEPDAEVKVSIAFADAVPIADGQEVQAVHFDESNAETAEEAEPSLLDADTEFDDNGSLTEIDFTQSSFSVTGVLITKQTSGLRKSALRAASGTDTDSNDDSLDGLSAGKSLSSNADGTYNLTLSVKGETKAVQENTTADVLVLFDESNSMEFDYYTLQSPTRLQQAKDALNALSEKLLTGNDSVRMAMVKFDSVIIGTTAWTSNAKLFESYYQSDQTYYSENQSPFTYRGGTNWDAALEAVDDVTFRPSAEKYVILVSDGDPTFYNDPNKTYYNVYGVTVPGLGGNGSPYDRTNVNTCYENTRDAAKELVDDGYQFYTIGVFNDEIGHMKDLTGYAYTKDDDGKYPDGRYQTASDEEALKQAFSNIVEQIKKTYSCTGIVYTDTLTEKTAADLSDDFVSGQFTYTIIDQDGKSVAVHPGEKENEYYYERNGTRKYFKGAVYNSEKRQIVWDMDPDEDHPFVIDDGLTYNVSFRVWPGQAAYDTAAELKNQGSTAVSPDDAIYRNDDEDFYRLRTNEDGTGVDYKEQIKTTQGTATTTDYVDKPEIYVENPEGVPLYLAEVKLRKIWDDHHLSNRPQEIRLQVIETASDGSQDTVKEVTLAGTSSGNEWESAATIYLSPGLKAGDEILDPGHDYTIAEPDEDSRYALTADHYHPMHIDDPQTVADENGTKITELTAVNTLQCGSVTLEKKIQNSDGKDITTIVSDGETVVNPAVKDDAFTFELEIAADGTYTDEDFRYAYNAQENYGKTGSEATSQGILKDSSQIKADSYSLTAGNNKTTIKAEITLKPHEQFMLVDLPIGAAYQLKETAAEGYDLVRGEINGKEKDSVQNTIEDSQTDSVVFTNQLKPFDVWIAKADRKQNSPLSGAVFTLQKQNGSVWEDVYDVSGKRISSSLTVNEKIEIGDLPSGTYRLKETEAPKGYGLADPVTFTVNRNKTGTEDAVAVAVNADDAEITQTGTDYYITVKDDEIYQLPSVGGAGIYWNFMIGTLVAVSSVYAVYAMRRGNGKEADH